LRQRFALAVAATTVALVSAAAVWFVDVDAVVRDLRTGRTQKAETGTASAIESGGAKFQGRLPDSVPDSAPAEGSGTDAVVRPTIMPDDNAPGAAQTATEQPQPQQDGAVPIDVATSEDETPDAAAAESPDSNVANDPSWPTQVVKPRPPAAPPRAPAITKSQPAPAPNTALPGAQHSYSLDERIAELSPVATQRIKAKFEAAKASYPPSEVALVAIKDEKVVELHARSANGQWQFVHRYKVLAASGTHGPKLRQGDNQVPEGVYGISLLNPNSKYHVSMRVDYPNAFDKEMAAKEGRMSLGGDIMIHGKNVSKGCLAVGDDSAEELFVLVNSVGLSKAKVIIAPTDLRKSTMPAADGDQPKWLPQLYRQVTQAMAPYPAPPKNGLLSLLGL
jgi:hypothetical protein